MNQLKAGDINFDYGFYSVTPDQKKEIINLILDKFILYRDGRIEL